jgi:serine/threonine-protein kinase HipA
MAWEATALDLLERSGVKVPWRRLARVGDRGVLILKRFDRSSSGERVGYISAMTATASRDGERRDYADIADAVRDLSLSVKRDLAELFRRVVASVALGNTDDHLRNHGFLAARDSWALSPAFDVNPNPDITRSRSTSILGADAFPDEVDALFAFADECDLNPTHAREQLGLVMSGFENWQELARANGIAAREVAMMAESIEPRVQAIAAALTAY